VFDGCFSEEIFEILIAGTLLQMDNT
jgi:hypothetical protein